MAIEENNTIPKPASGDADQQTGALVAALDASAAASGLSHTDQTQASTENAQKLAGERLGMVSALFAALSFKHPATAAHSQRVAQLCSSWAAAIGMPEKLRVQLEAAALLHDIGKIGVPDAVLTKPSRLSTSELRTIDQSSSVARKILTAAQAPQQIIEGVASTLAWFDGSHRSIKTKSENAPFISRMIAIADAFDSMTTDQVYRTALPVDRAVAILFESAGTQFDPELVTSFAKSLTNSNEASQVQGDFEERWLMHLSSPDLAAPALDTAPSAAVRSDSDEESETPFAPFLIESMIDAVICVDQYLRISYWNPSAERITGVGAAAALGASFSPGMIAMSRDSGELIEDNECPVRTAIATGLQSLERINAAGAGGRPMSLDVHVIPLRDKTEITGAAVILHDSSSEASLERRCRSLHVENSKDPLTQVANRAEFDRMLPTFVEVHQEIGLPFSLIMTDIDRFKRINDTHGHQAGDRAIIEFASLLKSLCRSGDLVARYGGEEFAVLCADCNTATAFKRADKIRERLAQLEHEYLDGASFTASFGVTELQVGDSTTTLLRRADRALLQAKDCGRNLVVQLGNGMTTADSGVSKSWFGGNGWWFNFGGQKKELVNTKLVTNVPIEMAVEKLKGFIADRDAKIVKADNNRLLLEVSDTGQSSKLPRETEKAQIFTIDLKLSQEHIEKSNTSGFATGSYAHTFIEVVISPKKAKKNKANLTERAQLMLGSLQSYVMAREDRGPIQDYMPEPASEKAQA